MGLVPGKLIEKLQDLVSDNGVQSGGGLVQHQKLCLMAEGDGDGELHFHTSGIVLEGGFLRQSETAAIGVEGILLPAAVGGSHHAAHLRGGEGLRKAPLVQHHADVLLGVQKLRGGDVHAQRGGGAAVRPQRAHENADEGGFARAVLAHQTADGPGGNGESHVLQRKFSEGFADMVQFDSICHRDPSHLRRSSSANSDSERPQVRASSAAAARWSSSR